MLYNNIISKLIINKQQILLRQHTMIQQSDMCEQCGKQATSMCSQCKWTTYCSKEHQLDHWRLHKQHCKIINSYRLRKEQEQLNKNRADLRKKYFQNFMHKIYDNCIRYGQEMVNLQVNHITYTRDLFNQLEYGISVCLLARSWLNVRCQSKAVVIMNNYLEEKMHFLKDMRDIVMFQTTVKKQNNTTPHISNQLIKQGNLTHESTNIPTTLKGSYSIVREFAIKKVSLIASVANILNAVKQPVIKFYDIYTQHIEKMFGKQSFQTSNCYFMVGSHYMQNHQYYKSIACFIRASEIRGNMAGDCYYNLGILFHLLKQSKLALMMFQNAAKLRQNQFSENSSEVADVYHNIALIHQSMGNYKGAIENLEKIALIYSKDKNSPEYKNAKQSIKALQTTFRKHMQKTNQASLLSGNPNEKKGRKGGKGQDDALSQNSFQAQKEFFDRDKKFGETNYLKLSDNFIGKLNPLESFHLSQLQIQLNKCQTIYMAANTLGASHFLKVIKLSKLQELIKDNQNLFKHVSIQKLNKRGIKDLNAFIG